MSVHLGSSHDDSDFDKQRAATKRKIAGMSGPIADQLNKEQKVEDDNEAQIKMMTARNLFHESMDMFREGDMKWDEMIKDLTKVLKEI